ncbi:type II toxin-antitoxin system HicB family antitoxin [Dehalococcoides mccartyi]
MVQAITKRLPLSYYKGLNYQIILTTDPAGGYVASINELPGCLSQGETIKEALANIKEAKELWLECTYTHKQEIEPPRTEGDFTPFVIKEG